MEHLKSNAPDGYPDITDTGYYLHYALNTDGTVAPDTEPRLIWGDQTYADEGEIERAMNNTTLRTKTSDLERQRQAYVAALGLPDIDNNLPPEGEADEDEGGTRKKRSGKR